MIIEEDNKQWLGQINEWELTKPRGKPRPFKWSSMIENTNIL